jgi:uncharacterized membrane protein
MPSARDILAGTRRDLSGRWIPLLLVLWAALICQAALGRVPKVGSLLSLALAGPLYVGMSAFSLGLMRDGRRDWESLLQGFERLGRNVAAFLLVLFWAVLGTLLLVVPGILWMLSYSQTFFILADQPELSAAEALARSKEMMRGHRLELVALHAWQFLLVLLSALTLFVALIWLVPYFYACWARFYDEVRKQPAPPTAPAA